MRGAVVAARRRRLRLPAAAVRSQPGLTLLLRAAAPLPRQACEPVLKTLLSAAANAKNNLGLKKAKLVVSECFADEGPVLKRAQPRAQVRRRHDGC